MINFKTFLTVIAVIIRLINTIEQNIHRTSSAIFGVKLRLFSYQSVKTSVLGAQKNRLIETEEPSHRDGSFEHPQHMFWLRNKKNQLHTLIWGPGILL